MNASCEDQFKCVMQESVHILGMIAHMWKLQCRSQAIMPRISGPARWCTNNESNKGSSWPTNS